MARIGIAAVAAAFIACSPGMGPETRWKPEPQGFSVVTLIEETAQPYTPPRWEVYCNAFAISRAGQTLLATASHCLRGAGVGDEVSYVPPSGWGLADAVVVYDDPAGDRALLLPEEPGDLLPLPEASPPKAPSLAISVSSYYASRSEGLVLADLGLGWRETTITIRKGWSGSPVMNHMGAAWGIVSGCQTAPWGGDCLNGYSKVTAIP
jgi:hypothetical protein